MVLTTVERCFLCERPDDYAGVLVTLDGAVRLVCDKCWSKQDDVRLPLDMTEDEDEFENREGQPEFNGAFNAW